MKNQFNNKQKQIEARTRRTYHNFVLDLFARGSLHSLDHFYNRVTITSTQIVYNTAALFINALHCFYMTNCQINNVNKVANTSAVFGVVISAKYTQEFTATNGNLRKHKCHAAQSC